MASTTLRKTLRSRGHRLLIELLVSAREQAGLTQRDVAARLKRPNSFIGRIEAGERRVDVIEFIEIARRENFGSTSLTLDKDTDKATPYPVRQQTHKELAAIVNAIAERKAKLAEELTSDHLMRTLATINIWQ